MKKLLLGTFFGAAMLLIVQLSTAFAFQYKGAWVPTDGDVNSYNFTHRQVTDEYDVLLYDFDNYNPSDDKTYLTVLKQSLPSEIVNFTQSSDWQATGHYGKESMNLGDSPDFGILFKNRSTGDEIFCYTVTPWNDVSYLISHNGTELLQVDAAPHSIPDASAMFLLGSACLMGFVGLGRKFTTNI